MNTTERCLEVNLCCVMGLVTESQSQDLGDPDAPQQWQQQWTKALASFVGTVLNRLLCCCVWISTSGQRVKAGWNQTFYTVTGLRDGLQHSHKPAH